MLTNNSFKLKNDRTCKFETWWALVVKISQSSAIKIVSRQHMSPNRILDLCPAIIEYIQVVKLSANKGKR